jgi:hypothetical protein
VQIIAHLAKFLLIEKLALIHPLAQA